MKKQFAVIGAGRFGGSLAKTLYLMGCDVMLIDNKEEPIEKSVDFVTKAIQAEATDIEALVDLGIRNFDTVIVAIGEDLQASVLITVILKELGVKTVVAKAVTDLHGKVLAKVGADRVVYPERDMGVRVAHQLISTNILEYIELSSDFSIVEVELPQNMVGKNMRQIDFRSRFGATVLAIKRSGKVLITPDPNEPLANGDILVILGEVANLVDMEHYLGN